MLAKRKSFGEKVAASMAAALGYDDPQYFDKLVPLSDTQASSSTVDSLPQGEKKMKLASVSRLKEREDTQTIHQYAAGGSMGFGLALPDQPGIIRSWQVSHEWLEKNARSHTGVGNLRIVTGFGPSMQPMFNPGDPLLVDAGVDSVIADGIYFFRVGEEGFIKQLQKIPTAKGMKYVAKSKNPDYDSFEITEDMDFEVLGRVIRIWCGTDF
jgi:phage repressor protein C with HTH and peptisase S24 domain